MSVEILFQDDDFIFVNKAYDMYINSDDLNEQNTVAYHIASPDSHLSSSSNPLHFVQRLDYSTSGVLCVCRHKTVAAKTGRLFEKRLAKKYYLAVIRGWLKDNCEVNYRIAEDPSTSNSNHKMLAVSSKDEGMIRKELKSRDATTIIMPLQLGFYRDEPCTVVLVKPHTAALHPLVPVDAHHPPLSVAVTVSANSPPPPAPSPQPLPPSTTSTMFTTWNFRRRHQIRVHCSNIGHTILGDYTYSNREDTIPHRMFLHAIRLILPFDNRSLDVYTEDVFFNDPKFSENWRSREVLMNYSNKEEIVDLCNVIDNCIVNKEYS